MQFNSETDTQDLISDITFLTGATITDYTLNNRTRNCNFGLDRVVGLILKSDQRWQFDDYNNTDLPIGTTNLVANQKDYGITGATYLKITKVMCKDSGGTWHILKPMDQHSPEAKDLLKQQNPGTPTHYDLIGNSIFLQPYPDYASTGGLRIFFQRNAHYFETDDTTAEPGFAQPFHRLISLYASEAYLASKGMIERLRGVQSMITPMEAGLIQFYTARNPEDRPRIRLRKENYLGGGGRKYQNKAINW